MYHSDKLVVRPVSLYAHLHNSHATMTRQFMQQTSQNACEIKKTITYTTLPSNTDSANYPRCLFLFPHSELCSIAKNAIYVGGTILHLSTKEQLSVGSIPTKLTLQLLRANLSNDKTEKIEVLRQSQGFTALEEKSNSGLQVNGTLLSASVTDPVADFASVPEILPPKFTPKRNKNTNGIAGLRKCTCMSDLKCA